jgi:hypothetical protein
MSLGDLTGQIVADLRNRLLDLRNSNKLLNYRHSERSKTQVRIVDELPDFLHESLTTGKSLSFRSLPELERLDGLKALAADDRFEYFRAAILEASNPDVDLVERYRSLERVTVELETLHSALSAGGLRADATPAQAEEILPLLERIKNLETNLSASQGQLLMGDYWRGVDTDRAGSGILNSWDKWIFCLTAA